MANTTTTLLLSYTTEVDEWIWWEVFSCVSDGRKAFSIIWCLFVVSMMIFVLYIIYTLIQNKPKSMRITLCYLIFSLLYYSDAIMMSMNQCYGRIDRVQVVGWYLRIISYALGFFFLLLLWFYRLYNIFKVTAYPLSKATLTLFIAYIVIGWIVVLLIVFTVIAIAAEYSVGLQTLVNLLNLFGLLWIIMGITAVPGLYIKKLYMIMLNIAPSIKHSFESSEVSEQENASELKLVLCISKNSILAAFTLFGSLLTLSISGIMGITVFASEGDQYWVRKVQLTVLLIDHTTNILGYVLGYSYAEAMYAFLCGCLDKPVRNHIANRLNSAGSVALENLRTKTSRPAQNIQPQESIVSIRTNSTMSTTSTGTKDSASVFTVKSL